MESIALALGFDSASHMLIVGNAIVWSIRGILTMVERGDF